MDDGKGRLAPVDFGAVKARGTIVDLLESVGWELSGRRRGDRELRGPCPIHHSHSVTSTIFSVTPSRNIFRCFKCEAGGDTIALAAYLFGIPADQQVKAAVELCKHLGVAMPRLR
jgi:DNA primase